VPGLPTPPGTDGLGGERGQRGIVTRECASEPTSIGCALLAQSIGELTKRVLIEEVDPRLEVISRCLRPAGELAIKVARNLFGKNGIGVLDSNDVRGAQDAQHQRATVGVVKAAGGQGERGRAVERQPKLGTADVDRDDRQVMKGH
jgi:hypothetical protein